VHLHSRYLICNSGVPTGREQSALFSIRAIVIEITLFMLLLLLLLLLREETWGI
jgi:hypothetical protein